MMLLSFERRTAKMSASVICFDHFVRSHIANVRPNFLSPEGIRDSTADRWGRMRYAIPVSSSQLSEKGEQRFLNRRMGENQIHIIDFGLPFPVKSGRCFFGPSGISFWVVNPGRLAPEHPA
jgi:hypothetical protein